MAEDLVFSTISNLVSLYSDEINSVESVNLEREKLESNLSAIKSVLEDAEKKQLANSSDVLNNWLKKLHDAVYELEDIVDDCSIEDIRDEYEGDKSCAFLGFLHPHKVMFRHSIIDRMKALRERLEFIAKEKDQFNFLPPERPADTSGTEIPNWRQTKSLVKEEIFGRKQDLETIVHHLLEVDTHGDTLYVYPIVGLGGLGKTALAQLVYHDERVTRHFELKKWICVSDNFDLKTLLKAITGSNESPDQLDFSMKKLGDMLQGKRYLIVLDDIWNENPDKWLELRSLLDCGEKGSSVVITTRLEKVAMMMRTPSAQPYHLTALSEEDCWQVFRKRAFGSCIVQETEDLVRIGKEIARKCKGVPLAAKTLGGLLMFKADERFWIKIRDSELWSLSEEEDSIFGALKLSYLNLSPRARRCFTFCSIFPKDHVISKMDLIHLWMSNGLISEGPSTTMELEDMGEEMVNDLYWRSLIQDVNRDPGSGNIVSFKMHDLVHDLAQSISTDVSSGTRHISIVFNHRNESHNLGKFKSLRSLVFLKHIDPVALAISNSLKHTRLRALGWSGLSSMLLPSSIDVLQHLRYLNLSYSDIRELPYSIGNLWNLQTLNLYYCVVLESFPVSIGRLKNLRHLYIEWCQSLSSMPQSMVGLTSLRTLNFVVLGGPKRKYEFQLSALEHMKYLRGRLRINHLERVIKVKNMGKPNLNEKQDLDDLCLSWGVEDHIGRDNNVYEQILILEALRPPPRLRHLELIGYKGIGFSHWMMKDMESFSCLRSLQIKKCKSCTQLPPLWKLPSLKELVLDSLGGIRYLIESPQVSRGEGFVCFPALEVLNIHNLPVLEKIIFGEEADEELNNKSFIIFSRLVQMVMKECPKLYSLNSSAFPSLKKLELRDLQSLRYLIENYQDSCGQECVPFPALEELNILSLSRLEKIVFGVEADQELNNKSCIIFPRLIQMVMKECPKLYSLNSSAFPYLKKLELLDLQSLRYLIENNQDFCGEECVPFPALEELNIQFFPSLEKIVLGVEGDQELNNKSCIIFPGLSELFMDDCPKLDSLNSLAFPSLKKLELRDLQSLRFLIENNQDSCGEEYVPFPALEQLNIESLPRLEKIVRGVEADQELNNKSCIIFPGLSELFMKECPKLYSLNSSAFPSLKKLELRDLESLRYLIENNQDLCAEECVSFPVLEMLNIQSLPRLETIVLGVEAGQELNKTNYTISPHPSFSSGPLPSLRSLRFNRSERIMFSMLTSASYKLQSVEDLCLIISRDTILEYFADQMFQGPENKETISSLGEFRISDFPKLQDLFSVVLQLTSLQKLSLREFPFKSFDTDLLTDLPSLQCLELKYCTNLESLPNWINQLASLEELQLKRCPRLTTLPDGIRQLSKLKRLFIRYCWILERRCEKETGEDWHKIAHIPNINH